MNSTLKYGLSALIPLLTSSKIEFAFRSALLFLIVRGIFAGTATPKKEWTKCLAVPTVILMQ